MEEIRLTSWYGSLSHDLQGFIHPRWLLRDFLHQQYQWSYGPLPIPKNPGSPCQMMSKGCIITETKRKVFRFHDTILSLGEPGSLGWRFGALPTTGFSMVHLAPGSFFLQSSEPWKYNWVDLGNRSGSRNDVTSTPFFAPGWREIKTAISLFRNPHENKPCSWLFMAMWKGKQFDIFGGPFHRTMVMNHVSVDPSFKLIFQAGVETHS